MRTLAYVMLGGLVACSAPEPPIPIAASEPSARPVPSAPPVVTDLTDTARVLSVTPAVAIDTGVRPAPAAVPASAAAADDLPRAVSEPVPIAVGWAPPPLVIDAPSSPRAEGAEWAAGFWNWNRGAWHWRDGEWAVAPRPGSHWVNPYYENRSGRVIFIPGYWSVPGLAFVPPIPGLRLPLQTAIQGQRGTAPKGPNGVFIPAPPGSRAGVIVPAPIGTAPAVLTGAPPLARSGMRITADIDTELRVSENVITMSEAPDVILQAPASATLDHHAFKKAVPADAALAAALFPWEEYGSSASAATAPTSAP